MHDSQITQSFARIIAGVVTNDIPQQWQINVALDAIHSTLHVAHNTRALIGPAPVPLIGSLKVP